MKDASSQLKALLTAQDGGRVHVISDSLRSRADFLLSFNPTGELQQDMESLLRGTGEQAVLVVSRRHGLSLRELAASIRHNHQDELGNLQRGGHPLWLPKSETWSPDKVEFYRRILALEVEILDSILNLDTGLSAA
jgi:hypothetical protein